MDTLFSLLGKEAPLDTLLTSYFIRVVTFLLVKRPIQIISYLEKRENTVEQLLAHIYSPAISELLIKLLTCSQSDRTDQVGPKPSKERGMGLIISSGLLGQL